MTPTLENKTLVMSGGSRGIGLAVALRAARDGAADPGVTEFESDIFLD